MDANFKNQVIGRIYFKKMLKSPTPSTVCSIGMTSFLKIFFLMWTIFKVFIKIVTLYQICSPLKIKWANTGKLSNCVLQP